MLISFRLYLIIPMILSFRSRIMKSSDFLFIVIKIVLVKPDHIPLPLKPGELSFGKMSGIPL